MSSPDDGVPPEVIAAMARKPFTYLGRKGAHYLVRYPITVSWPVSLIHEWGPQPVDSAAVAHGDNGVSSPVLVSERVAAFGEFVEDSVAREREKQRSMTLPANEILIDGTIAR